MLSADPIADFLGVWASEITLFSVLLRVVLSMLFGAVLGCERSSKRHAAGLRTFMLVSVAATMAVLLDMYFIEKFGTQFCLLSAATIIGSASITVYSVLFSSRSQIKGLTTAAALWACCILGLVIGAGWYTASVFVFFAVMITLSVFPRFEKYLKDKSNHFEIHLELKDASYLSNFVATLRELNLSVDDIEANSAYLHSGLAVYSISLTMGSDAVLKYRIHSEIVKALNELEYVHYIEEMN